jgi:hypothetical protein
MRVSKDWSSRQQQFYATVHVVPVYATVHVVPEHGEPAILVELNGEVAVSIISAATGRIVAWHPAHMIQ